tara:strand:- start:251 stop:406 length:156 start_codon:yes stop_codon:yes gene_type:complete
MTRKQLKKIDSKGREETWEWEETPEAKSAIEKLHKTAYEMELKAPNYGARK